MVEEYAAQLLLKYDKNHIATTMSEAQIEEERVALEHRAAVQAQIAEERARQAEAERQEQASQETTPEEGGGEGEGGGAVEIEAPVYADIDEF